VTTVKLFEDYPYLTDGVVIIRKMTEDDAEALAVLASEADVYSTLPTFLYELKYEDKLRTIRMMDEECFDTGESVLMGIYLTEDPRCLAGIAEIYNYEEKKGKASIG
jgi:RimJ/RimL family protein N-acetyltransferase